MFKEDKEVEYGIDVMCDILAHISNNIFREDNTPDKTYIDVIAKVFDIDPDIIIDKMSLRIAYKNTITYVKANTSNELYKKFIHLYFVKLKSTDKICKRLHISEDTVDSWFNTAKHMILEYDKIRMNLYIRE